MSRKEKVWLILLVGLILAIFYKTFVWVTSDEFRFEQDLRNALNTKKNEIRLKDITHFKWDEVCFYPPYSYNDTNPKEPAIPEDEHYYYIQFNLNNKQTFVTNIIYTFSNPWELEKNGKLYCYKDDVIIVIDGYLITDIRAGK